MFLLGAIIGLALGGALALVLTRKQRDRLDGVERTSSSQFRRITALEKELAEVKTDAAARIRAEKLRNAREFGQYKTLLRRADVALAQAKAARRGQVELDQAA